MIGGGGNLFINEQKNMTSPSFITNSKMLQNNRNAVKLHSYSCEKF